MSYGNYGNVHVPRLTPVNKILLVVCGAFFLLQSILKVFTSLNMESVLGLTPGLVSNGHIYQLLTYPLVQNDLMSFLFNGMVVWFVGSDLESQWGSKTYGKFLLTAVLGAGLIFFMISFLFFSRSPLYFMPLLSVSGICFSLLMAYGLIFKERILTFMLVFPMKAKYFCMVLMGIELYMGFFSPYGRASWGHLGAALCGFLFLRYFTWKSRWRSRGGGPKPIRKTRSHLHLVEEGRENMEDSRGEKEEKGKDGDGKKGPRFWQ